MRLSFQHSFGGNTRIFTHRYFSYSGSLSAADALTLANTAATKWIADVLQAGLSSGCSLIATTITDLNSSSGTVQISTVTGSGSNAATALTAGVALVIELQIARRFRGGHARIYLPGMVTTHLATGETWTTAIISAQQTGQQNFAADFSTTPPAAVGTIAPVTVSYFKGFSVSTPVGKRAKNIPTLNPLGPTVDTIIGYKAQAHIASQRRRNQVSL